MKNIISFFFHYIYPFLQTIIAPIILKLYEIDTIIYFITIITIAVFALYQFYRIVKYLMGIENKETRQNFSISIAVFTICIILLSFSFFKWLFALPDNSKEPVPFDNVNCIKDGVCLSFSDIKAFTGGDYFFREGDNNNLFLPKSKNRKNLDNPNLFIKDKYLSIGFSFRLQVVFHNNSKANLTIVYGDLWRLIIGEGSFNKIVCESYYNDKINKRRQIEYLSENKKPRIQPKTNVLISGRTEIIAENNIKINITIDYFDIYHENQQAEFFFPVKVCENNLNGKQDRFGVGIIEVVNGSRIEFKMISVK